MKKYIENLIECKKDVINIKHRVGDNKQVQATINNIILQIGTLTENLETLEKLDKKKIGFLTFLNAITFWKM